MRCTHTSLLLLVLVVMISLTTGATSAPLTLVSPTGTPSPRSMSAAPLPDDATLRKDRFQQFRKEHPEAAWPHWFADDHTLAWTAIGLNGGGVEALINTDGTFSSNRNNFGVSFWLRDTSTGEFLIPQPASVVQSLQDGHLPLVTTTWETDKVTLRTTLFTASSGTNPISANRADDATLLVRATLSGRGATRPWTLYLAVRPFDPAGGVASLQTVSASKTSVTTNGALALVAFRDATRSGASDESAVDVSVGARVGNVPAPPRATSARGMAEGVLAYDVVVGGSQTQTFDFALPLRTVVPSTISMQHMRRMDVGLLQQRVAEAWIHTLHSVELSIPDSNVTNAWYASLAYMLMTRQNDQLSSGPLSERAFWIRDAAYITQALSRAGQIDVTRNVVQRLAQTQFASGRFPPIIEADGKPRQPVKTEWDTQGQAITAFVEYARQSGDMAFLRGVYPRMIAAARYQQAQLIESRSERFRGTPSYGILPAGESAEDLYDADWHHYWDDFWALAGYQEAAEAADILGQSNDEHWLTEELDTLRRDLLASVSLTRAPDGRSFIPNGPEDRTSTAMARSATPALWPVMVMDPSNEVVQYSFEMYYQHAIKPYAGAYQHYNGHYWPYAGISLAHAYYRLGRIDRTTEMLDWALTHQTAPHMYAWAEVVHPDTGRFALGDMPHTWMAAEMVLLISDILARPVNDHIEIGPFPDTWLPIDGTMTLRNGVSTLGPVSYTLTRSHDGHSATLTLDGTGPAGGFRLALTPSLVAKGYAVDGGAVIEPNAAGVMAIPGTAHTVMIQVTPKS